MFQRLIDEFKESVGTAARLIFLVLMTAAALLIALSFLCAAAFICVLQRYGVVTACLAGAAVFFLIGIIGTAIYFMHKRRARTRAKKAKSTSRSFLTDPMLLATGLQVARGIGIKRLLPILAVGGLALGFLAGRRDGDEDES